LIFKNIFKTERMETKKFTHYGTFQIIILGMLLVVFAFKSYNVGLETTGLIYAGLFLLTLVGLLFMYRTVIEIDEFEISFKFGIGLFKRNYQISNLTSCTSVRNSLFSGFGIRRISNGWLYNVSGFKGVELRFVDKKNIIRIGTTRPDEISNIVTNLIGKNKKTNESPSVENSNSIEWSKWIFSIIILFSALLFSYDCMNDNISIHESDFKISGDYSKSIKYQEISEIDTISVMPEIGARTNGFYFMNIAKGYFILGGIGSFYLNLRLMYHPYIKVVLRNNDYIFFNLNNPEETKKLFKNIKDKTLKSRSK